MSRTHIRTPEGDVRAGILIRLSHEKDTQLKTDEAFERFEKACRRLCKSRGWPVVDVFFENIVSAYQGKKRPQFELALRALERDTIDVLVVPTVDRLVRRTSDAGRIKKIIEDTGKLIITADGLEVTPDNPASRFLFGVLAEAAEFESANTSARTKRQIAQQREKGRPHRGGRRPYGFTELGGEVIEDEAKVIREVTRRILAGYSVISVTEWFNAATGLTWVPQTLGRALRRPALAGLLEYETDKFIPMKTKDDTDAKPILDRATWEQLRTLLKDPSRKKGGRSPGRLLSGILLCGHCGRPLEAAKRGQRVGHTITRIYRCNAKPGRGGCGGLSIAAEPLEDYVIVRALKRWANVIEVTEPGEANPNDPAAQALAAKIRELENKLSDLGRQYAANKLSMPAFLAADVALREQLQSAYSEFQYAVSEKSLIQLPPVESFDEAMATYLAMDITMQRATIRHCCDDIIVIKPAERKANALDKSRVLFADAAKSYLATK
jgi:site-specific DNA recombinase